MESKKDNNTQVEIKDALTCFICASKVSEPLMCHKCKKLVCTKCIKKWYENHDKCPYCQVQSSFDKMISLPFMDEISQFFMNAIDNNNQNEEKKKKIQNIKEMNKIIDEDDIDNSNNDININLNNNNNDEDDEDVNNKDNYFSKTHFIPNKFKQEEDDDDNNSNNQKSDIKKGEKCPIHKNELIEYYCLNCNTKHCSKCFLFFNEESKIHKEHKIISIEQKNKFNIDEIKEDFNSLSNVINEIIEYKNNIEMNTKIISKKEEFIKKVMDELKEFYNKKTENKKTDLDIKNQKIKNQLDKIYSIKNNYPETLKNYIEAEDENGLKEYHQKIKDFKDINKYKYLYNYNMDCNLELKIFETDFIDIDINEYEETIGEIYFNIEGINQQLHFKLNGQTIDEVLINLQIELNDLGEDKERYYAYILFNNQNNIIPISLEEKMIDNGILILGRTIIKSGLSQVVDEQNKCHIKLLLAHFTM